jgi:hypothetical protein
MSSRKRTAEIPGREPKPVFGMKTKQKEHCRREYGWKAA